MPRNPNEPLTSYYLHSVAARDKFPVSCNLELTPRCNMDCKMCYLRKTEQDIVKAGLRERTAEEWTAFARECKEAGTIFILLTGGEPFLRKDFQEIYIALHEMGFMISINTNGTLIDETVMAWLKKYPPYRINMTLYGASNDTYGRLCGNPKGLDQMLRGAGLVLEAGISLKLNASMTPYNIADLADMYRIAKELNVYMQATAYMFPPVRKDREFTGGGDRFSAEDAARYSLKIDRMRLLEEEFQKHVKGICEGVLLHKGAEAEQEGAASEPLWCRAGRSTCWVNWTGEMTPCGLMNYPSAEPFASGVLNAFRELSAEVEKIRMPAKCTGCRHRFMCHVCGAAVQAETGNFTTEPDYICRMTESIAGEAEKYHAIELGSRRVK